MVGCVIKYHVRSFPQLDKRRTIETEWKYTTSSFLDFYYDLFSVNLIIPLVAELSR